ncbi:MAG: PEGA domain-containing protein [Terriglobales bacterium]|jgi:serine/threonine protein kinase
MGTMFGRFEVQSELSRSETALIYKALDLETNQVVALKTQSLEPLGKRADGFVSALISEGESTRELAGQNIVLLYGAGEIDNQYCAAMEYIQGNSVATMLARKEGFSIWDLLDITRQVCAGLEQAAAKNVVHRSLEPAKIMVQWDGMVKILGYGISNMSLIEAESGKGLGRLMPYCSPEQIRGEAIDLRSNIFSLGTILYEMLAGRPAFDAADPVALVNQVENEMPPSPASVNAKVQPAVSALVMKALAKDPADRYQSARALVEDLEQCKENGAKKLASDSKSTTAATKVTVAPSARAAAVSKFISSESNVTKPERAAPAVPQKPSSSASNSTAASRVNVASQIKPAASSPSRSPMAPVKAGAAAAGASNTNSGARLISDLEVDAAALRTARGPVLSTGVAERGTERPAPRVAVDPMMAEPVSSSSGKSFSDLAEMPPLKEPIFAPPVAEPEEPMQAGSQNALGGHAREEEKPGIQPREVAEKAIRQIVTVPPRLMMYSIMGAVGLILVVALAVFFHVRSEDDGATVAPRPTKVVERSEPQNNSSVIAQPVGPVAEAAPRLTVRPVEKRSTSARRVPAPAPAPVVIAAEALIDSTPSGAQFQVDGKNDASWVTPFNVLGLSPGKHIVSLSKTGYSSEIRSLDVAAGSKQSIMFHLAPVNALLVVNSTPAGANVIVDGRNTGRVTPVQFAVEKGSHTVLLRKQGYLDETITADLGPAQNFQYSPALRALGNTEDMRTVGKFNRLFGRGGESTAGMGSMSIHTQPKGAQVAINNQVLDKLAPVDVMLSPGNYIVDITLTGFKPVHKVVSVDKGSKEAINEILERQ